MDIQQAKKIIESEGLFAKNFFDTSHLHADEVAIEKRQDHKFVVFTTGERMSRDGLQEFTTKVKHWLNILNV
ncbi:hypothetical protein FEI15_01455 [Lacticaseibacillus zeae]|uniref:Uncharacterized protein n=1 Tax=Lacticaseibacillus zeae TaxID=57037 RepID=A0A5R8LX84_LACZE|nr:hypothetical protein [Lacticaseibacillus zeae]TLF41904.1 hypothetical protein FEI15_01455 [Lacticaseibacillus zeae]